MSEVGGCCGLDDSADRCCPGADSALWDPRYHGSVMMVPVLYCTCILSIMAATFALFVGLRLWQHRVRRQPFRAHTKETQDEEEVGLAFHNVVSSTLSCLSISQEGRL